MVHHGVHGVFELQNFALNVDGDLLGKVAIGDRSGDVGNVTNLGGEVSRHGVDRVGQVFPGAGHAFDFSLSAQFAFGADFARHTGHLGSKGTELIDHGVHGVLQLEDLTFDIDGDLLGKVAIGDRGRDLGDVTDLRGKIAGHRIDRIGEVLPGAGHAFDFSLSTQFAFGADLPSDTRHLRSEGGELVHHRVDGVFQLEDFAPDIDGNFLREIAVGHSSGDFGDIANLRSQVASHKIDIIRQVFPGAGHAFDFRLAAEFAFSADFASDTRHLGGEGGELVDHRVDDVFDLENFPADVDGDLLGQVAIGNGGGDLGNVSKLHGQVAGHEIDVVGQVFPGAGHAFDFGLAAQLAFGADFTRHAGHFGSKRTELVDHRVDGVLELEDFAFDIDGDLLGKVAVGHRRGHLRDIADLSREVARHGVDRVG